MISCRVIWLQENNQPYFPALVCSGLRRGGLRRPLLAKFVGASAAASRQERWEPFTLGDLRAEEAQREGEYVRYRQPRIQRKLQPPQIVKDADSHIL